MQTLMSHIEAAGWDPHAELSSWSDSYHAYAIVEAVEGAKLGCNSLLDRLVLSSP
jgi:hypothetical protein